MEKDAARIVAQLEGLSHALARLEGKIDAMLMGRGVALPSGEGSVGRLRTLTRRQHGALQMLLRGASNAEIAERFGVSENTAKVYVRGIAAKVGAQTRSQIVALTMNEVRDLSAAAYQAMAGIPKDWASTNEGGLSWFPDGRGTD
jgi:DNA-binding CsgD family transcriptional regulator